MSERVNESPGRPGKSRVGQFSVPLDNVIHFPALVRKIMGKCIVFDAGMVRDEQGNRYIHYLAECQEFDLTQPDETLPLYQVNVTPGSLGYRIDFVRFTEAQIRQQQEKAHGKLKREKGNGKARKDN